MKLLEKLKLQQVKRYPICFTYRDQSVAEHSFNVAMIAAELAKATGDDQFRADCIEYALHHDLEEVYTGDIPSSFKRHLITMVPAAKPLVSDPTEVNSLVKATVKLADYLEAIYFLQEFGGSREAKHILDDIKLNFIKCVDTSVAPDSVVDRARFLLGTL